MPRPRKLVVAVLWVDGTAEAADKRVGEALAGIGKGGLAVFHERSVDWALRRDILRVADDFRDVLLTAREGDDV